MAGETLLLFHQDQAGSRTVLENLQRGGEADDAAAEDQDVEGLGHSIAVVRRWKE
jgi:hypothetical protein